MAAEAGAGPRAAFAGRSGSSRTLTPFSAPRVSGSALDISTVLDLILREHFELASPSLGHGREDPPELDQRSGSSQHF